MTAEGVIQRTYARNGISLSSGEHNYYLPGIRISCLNQCTYGLFLDVKEGDFLAIVRTLK